MLTGFSSPVCEVGEVSLNQGNFVVSFCFHYSSSRKVILHPKETSSPIPWFHSIVRMLSCFFASLLARAVLKSRFRVSTIFCFVFILFLSVFVFVCRCLY